MAEPESINILTDRVERIACHSCGHRINVANIPPFYSVECPNCKTQTPVPARLGTFLLFKRLGQGAMGAVYQAFDTSLKRHVAIKVMHHSLGEDANFVKQFLGEARALASLNHPHVVQIYTCGQEKGQPYMVMELLPGGGMDAFLKEEQRPDEAELLRWTVQVAQGLQAAQGVQLIHGDVKPENILFSRKFAAKVVDFGLAQLAGEAAEDGQVWGTPYYMAPEKARGAKATHRSDIYSLGATLFHLLTKTPPFDGETAQDVVMARLHSPAPDIRTVRKDLHDETAAVVARMLEQEPSRRYPSYDSLIGDMEKALTHLKTGDSRDKARPPKRHRPHAAALAWVMLGGATLVAVAIWVHTQREPSKSQEKPARVIAVNKTPAKPAPTARLKKMVRIKSSTGRGADTYVQGYQSSPRPADATRGTEDALWVKGSPKIHLSRKIYLRFDMKDVEREAVRRVVLRLTAIRSGANKKQAGYTLRLWAIPADDIGVGWTDGTEGWPLTWDAAPANATDSGEALKDPAVFVAEISAPARWHAGTVVEFTNEDSVKTDALLDAVRGAQTEQIVFAVTAKETPSARSGWKFASKEYKGLAGPQLVLK